MKKYLIDTNIIIYYINNDRKIVNRLINKSNIYISTISVGELYFGVNVSSKKNENIKVLDKYINYFDILGTNINTAYHYATIRATLRKIGKPIPDNDIWIAAIAKEHNLIIATRDKHFLSLDFIQTENW